MPDQFEILIKYGLDATKAREAAGELRKIEEQSKRTGKEGVAAEEQVTAATTKGISAKKQAKDAVRGLAAEFPVLGRLGGMVLNPITASVMAIVASFRIWKLRVDELTYSLGGVALPDVTEDHIARMERFAGKLKDVADRSKEAQTALKATQDTIDANAGFLKALGIDVGTGPDIAKADAARAAAADLAASGQAKMAAGINARPADIEEAKAMVVAAEADISSRRGRLSDIEEFRETLGRRTWMGRFDPRRLWQGARHYMRYGLEGSATAIEQAGMAQSQNTVQFYQNLTARAALESAGRAEMGQAQEISGGAVAARRGIGNASAGNFKAALDAVNPNDIASIGPKMLEVVQAFLAMKVAVDQANQELRNRQRLGEQLK